MWERQFFKKQPKTCLGFLVFFFNFIIEKNYNLIMNNSNNNTNDSKAMVQKYFPFTLSRSSEKWICDPLTTIIRLYTLQYRPSETKLDFSFGTMNFDLPTPSIPFLQWFYRRLKRVGKDDIIVLKETINQFLKIYNLNLPQIRAFAIGAIKGLEKLYNVIRLEKIWLF